MMAVRVHTDGIGRGTGDGGEVDKIREIFKIKKLNTFSIVAAQG